MRRYLHLVVLAALFAPLLSLVPIPAHAVAPLSTCATGGVCQIGDIGPGGGIVFYVAPSTFTQIGASGPMCTTNCKYLEAAPTSGVNAWIDNNNASGYEWSGKPFDGIGTTGTAIGTGYANTLAMVSQSNTAERAGTATRAFRGPNNLSDWFLPSKDELGELASKKGTVGLLERFYWSSSERNPDPAASWGFDVQDLNSFSVTWKANILSVRPIRAFAPLVAKLAITRAALGTRRGAAFTTQPQITVLKNDNETVTASSAIVTATISTAGTLVGTTTATATSGVATFSNLGVDGTIGSTYTITYSADGLVPVTATVTLTGTACDGITFNCQLGDTGPGGGLIFYVSPTTFSQQGATVGMCQDWCKYLEVAPSGWAEVTEPLKPWAASSFLNSAIGHDVEDATTNNLGSIGLGYYKSNQILLQNGPYNRVTNNYAAGAARAYRFGRFNDWYLPTRTELNLLCQWARGVPASVTTRCQGGTLNSSTYGATLAGFASSDYWSSSEIDNSNVSCQAFSSGSQRSGNKSDPNAVRPIRAFGVAPTAISIPNVVIPAPVRGSTPVSSITSNGQYTTAITWSGSPSIFDSNTAYTATVTVTPIAGYTLDGVATNFFTVNGSAPASVVTNDILSRLGPTEFSPVAVAVDLQGNVYTANSPSNNVTKITPAGVTTIAGPTGSTPNAIAVDSSGNVYTVNNGANTITRIAPSGAEPITTIALPGASDSKPRGISIDRIGNVYTVNEAGTVSKIATNGTVSTIGTTGADPKAIAVDSLGNVYTTNLGLDVVTKIATNGTVSTFGATGASPRGIAIDAFDNLYIANSGGNTVTKITRQGVSSVFGTTAASPTFIAVDLIGNVYTVNIGVNSNTITKISSQGISTDLGGAGSRPNNIAVDATGNVYASAGGNLVVHPQVENRGIFTYQFPATASLAPSVAFVAPTPIPFLKTLTKPKINLKDGKLICTPGTYNFGYTLDGVVQAGGSAVFTPSSFTYNLLINNVTQSLLSVTTAASITSWNLPAVSSGALITCSVTVSAYGVTSTDKSTDNPSLTNSALLTQATAVATATATYISAVSTNEKAYQKALVDNRAKWRSDIENNRTDYYAKRDRIKSLLYTKTTRAEASAAVKAYIAAQRKYTADYKASQPAAAAARDAANKAALEAKTVGIAKANATYGTFIESIGYGVLIP